MAGWFLKKKSLTRKFLSYMLLIGLVPLLFFGIISTFTTNGILKDMTVKYNADFVEQRKHYIELIMSDIESLIINVSGIDDIKAALGESVTDSSYDRLSTQAKIGYILSGYTNLKGLVSIDIFSNYGTHFHVGETLNSSNVNVEIKERIFNETVSSKEFIYWSGIEHNINKDSTYTHVIVASKALYGKAADGQSREAEGLLVVSFDPAVFTEGLGSKEGRNGYSLVLDSKKRILYHHDARYIGETISGKYEENLSKNEGQFEQRIEGQDTLVIYSKTSHGGWIVASHMPLESIYARSKLITIGFMGLLVMAIFAIAIFGASVSRQVVAPIKKVIETFSSLQRGDLEKPKRFKVRTDDEIGELEELFNSFIDAREDITLQKKLERILNSQNEELQKALEKLKATQAQMLQQEKLAGIGQLAAGVAHEINNPLAFVTGNFDTIRKYVERYESMLESVKQIKNIYSENSGEFGTKACEAVGTKWNEYKIDSVRIDMKEILSDTEEGLSRISAIVRGLTSFSRVSKNDEKTVVNLNNGIKTTLLVVNNQLKYSCTVKFKEGEIPMFYANGGLLNQVILNILVNAIYAIKEKYGEDKGLIEIETYQKDNYIFCKICDDGCGMSEEVKSKVFEPFFTTKPVGQGTGLGMGIAYDIIHNKHGGYIDIKSEPGVGTCVTIAIPIIFSQNLVDVEDGEKDEAK